MKNPLFSQKAFDVDFISAEILRATEMNWNTVETKNKRDLDQVTKNGYVNFIHAIEAS